MKTVAISLLGTSLDQRGKKKDRWQRWRPTVSLCQHEDLLIDQLELIYNARFESLADQVAEDIALTSPETQVKKHCVAFPDPWDFAQVYSTLLDFAQSYAFDRDNTRYLVHITTGTHVAQICLFLLTESNYLPAALIQTSPPRHHESSQGSYQIIDLDLSRYDLIAQRFETEKQTDTAYLKGGIQTKNADFNKIIQQIEQVSIRSTAPILLTGPTGAGKTQLANRIFELRKQRSLIGGRMVAVNCATLRGDNAMSALFGHHKGAFTGAVSTRPGLLKEAHQGLLFLDEIGELGLDEQAMLLRAIEEKRFMPLGADKETHSDFQLIAGTHRDLYHAAQHGTFRADLLARIDLWTYRLPALRERPEDIPPNIDYELERYAKHTDSFIGFNTDARKTYLAFATSAEALWAANFRDLNASITRMATLATGGRITLNLVQEEISRLTEKWKHHLPQQTQKKSPSTTMLEEHLAPEILSALDLYEQYALIGVIEVCKQSRSMAAAGRSLFNVSRTQKSSKNDSHRIKQLLERYGLSFETLKAQ